MYQGTTPTIPLKLKGIDLTAAKIIITMRMGGVILNFQSEKDFDVSFDGENTVGRITLSQEQTLKMKEGSYEVQARWVFPDGSSGASKETTVQVKPVLYRELITYADE